MLYLSLKGKIHNTYISCQVHKAFTSRPVVNIEFMLHKRWLDIWNSLQISFVSVCVFVDACVDAFVRRCVVCVVCVGVGHSWVSLSDVRCNWSELEIINSSFLSASSSVPPLTRDPWTAFLSSLSSCLLSRMKPGMQMRKETVRRLRVRPRYAILGGKDGENNITLSCVTTMICWGVWGILNTGKRMWVLPVSGGVVDPTGSDAAAPLLTPF